MQSAQLAALALALFFATSCKNGNSSTTWVHISEGGSVVSRSGDELEVRWNVDGAETRVELQGRVELTDDDRDVLSFAGDGELQIRSTGDGPRRELIVRSDDEELERIYRVDDQRAEWDDDAASWLAEVLGQLVRRTGLGAHARAERILAEGGPKALAEALRELDPGVAQKIYVEHLLEERALDPAVLAVAIQVAPKITSESSRALIVRRVAPQATEDVNLTGELLTVIESLASSSTRAELLAIIAAERELPPTLRIRAIRAAGGISAEGQRLSALIALEPPTAEASVEQVWLSTASTINSSAAKSEALITFLARPAIDSESYERVIEVARTLATESSRTAVLSTWLERAPASEENRGRWVAAAAGISASGLKAELLTELAAREDATAETLVLVADAAQTIASESLRSALLTQLAKEAPDSVLNSVLEAIATIPASSTRAKPLIALLEREELDDATLQHAGQVIEGIPSSSTRSEVQALLIDRLGGSR